MNHSDDEMFDDLHAGVEALRALTPLSPKAAELADRIEHTVPIAKNKFRAWKERLKGQAVWAAQKTDQVVRDHPWISTLSALGLGVLAGMALSSSLEEDEQVS
ncbi:MAG: hypothetical protein HY360_10900 [Verrucomicrobia bacterium]|nr:hypothetical protein [Verrucomicrobiota bacterium]